MLSIVATDHGIQISVISIAISIIVAVGVAIYRVKSAVRTEKIRNTLQHIARFQDREIVKCRHDLKKICDEVDGGRIDFIKFNEEEISTYRELFLLIVLTGILLKKRHIDEEIVMSVLGRPLANTGGRMVAYCEMRKRQNKDAIAAAHFDWIVDKAKMYVDVQPRG